MKKGIAAVLAAATVLTASQGFAWEQVNSDSLDQAKQLLNTLDIMDNITSGGYQTNDQITRGELADIILRISGSYDSRAYTPIFKDVTEETEYADSISQLTVMGVIARSDEYHPGEVAKYEHAVKMLLYVLGYEVQVESGGGWLDAVLKTASEVGLTKGIQAGKGDELNAGMLLALCYNALDCKVLERNMDNEFETDADKTLLSEKLHISKKKGIVNANSITSLTGAGAKGTARIGDLEIEDPEDLAEDYLGMEVNAYYYDENNDQNLVFLSATNKNNVVTVRSDDLLPEEAGFGYTAIYYSNDESKRTQKIRVDEEADVIYNGKAFPSYTLEDYNLESGSLRFLDHDGDNVADVVFIEETENYVADSVNTDTMQVYDMYGKTLDLEDCDNVRITDMYGTPLELSKIVKWNVLSVQQSKDKDLTTITVYNDPVIGDVQSVYKDDGKTWVTIDGDTFAVSKSYEKALEKRHANAKEIALSQSGTYYLDAEEKIAAVVLDDTNSWRYAYLIKAYYEEGDEATSFKLIYDNTGAKRYNGAKSIRIDGYKKEAEKITQALSEEGETKPQLIKFMMNGQGEIAKIDTAEHTDKENSENLTKTLSNATGYWSIRTRRVGNGQNIGIQLDMSSTIIFQVPTAASDKYNEDKYSIRTSQFKNNESITYDAYDVNSVGVAKAAVVQRDDQKSATFKDEQMLIISKITETLGADDLPQTVIKGYNPFGEEQTIKIADSLDTSKLSAGDIIVYNTNYKNEVDTLSYVYYHKDGTATTKLTDFMHDSNIGAQYAQSHLLFLETGDHNAAFDSNAKAYLTANIIADKQGSYIKAFMPGVYFNIGDLEDYNSVQVYEQSCPFYSSAPVTVYLCENGKVEKISWNDLDQYVYSRNQNARALLYATYSQLRCVYIYN